jgi:hypothetical protein
MMTTLGSVVAASRPRRLLMLAMRGARAAGTTGLAASLVMACAVSQSTTNSANGSLDTGVASASPRATQGGGSVTDAAQQQANTLTDAERRAGWRLLFDGTTLDGWRRYQGDTVPAAWRVSDGTINKTVPTRDIVSREQFSDFELVFDWRVATGGNAGVFYRATEEYDRVYWSAPEYQLLDDPNAPDGRDPLTSAGSAYGLYPAPRGVVRPAGEWNTSRVVARGTHVEHWLNGTKIVEYEALSPDWEAKVKASKFKDWPNYGRATRGHIAIQGDHRGDLALRNIKIREIR